MEYFAGLDVSLETVNVCIVNAAGDILLEKKIAAEPAAIVHLLKGFGSPFKRIGLEAGPTSSWLYGELRAAGYGAICLECRHVKAGLSAMRNKTDRNDARGIAQLVRLGWFRQVHVKSEEAQRTRMLLVNRQQLLTKALDIENSVRGSLRFSACGSVSWPGEGSRRGYWNSLRTIPFCLRSPSQCCAFAKRSSKSSNGSIDSANSWRGVIPSAAG